MMMAMCVLFSSVHHERYASSSSFTSILPSQHARPAPPQVELIGMAVVRRHAACRLVWSGAFPCPGLEQTRQRTVAVLLSCCCWLLIVMMVSDDDEDLFWPLVMMTMDDGRCSICLNAAAGNGMIRYADPLIQDGDEDLFWPLVMMTMDDATHAAMLQQCCMMHAGNGMIRYADPLIHDDDEDLFWLLAVLARCRRGSRSTTTHYDRQ